VDPSSFGEKKIPTINCTPQASGKIPAKCQEKGREFIHVLIKKEEKVINFKLL